MSVDRHLQLGAWDPLAGRVGSALQTAVQELGQALGAQHVQLSLAPDRNGEGAPAA